MRFRSHTHTDSNPTPKKNRKANFDWAITCRFGWLLCSHHQSPIVAAITISRAQGCPAWLRKRILIVNYGRSEASRS